MKIKFYGVQFAPHAPSPSWIVSSFLLCSVCTLHVTGRFNLCVWRNVMVCARQRAVNRLAHVGRSYWSIYVSKNETCLFVLSKCKHNILFVFHFCALKEFFKLAPHSKQMRMYHIKCVLSHTINYHRVSIAFSFVIIRAAVQQHKQYNKLPNYASGTTQRNNKCLQFSIWSQNGSLCTVWLIQIKTNKTGCIAVCSQYTPCVLCSGVYRRGIVLIAVVKLPWWWQSQKRSKHVGS